ncbi:Acetyltransferase involved in cellulose biosynthesis, CelD/BcsL family [Devosia lucknowensis]|uniref:Acetyltransferase involved in cellulose biosynthesis, CelD/BcsL family n=1 Tax=Devosia lucknowensis TaxID=1096929 RepID=A0A1Y6F608_9HYPH|nr:GNAT family N-acetyltransferase [Devosia lucknowensis]SMQ70305.1 Acetyltransferase involved in cellulose biosynthesis, CelD/BcsL family [Devosia lucknowensis]
MPGKGNLNSRVLATLEEIDAIADAWRALEADCADPYGYFQTYDWCRNWVATFGDDGVHAPYIVTVWDGDLLVALWPRMVVQAAGIRRLETLGVPHTQYCSILVRPGPFNHGDLVRVLRAALRQSGCDVILSRAVLAGSTLEAVLGDKPVIKGSANVASMLDLSDFEHAEDYVEQLGKLQKRNRNRRRNHLARLGALSFEVVWPGDKNFDRLVERCVQMKRRWLTETGRLSAGFAMRSYDDFLAALPGRRDGMNGACLSVLRSGDRVVALELGFLHLGHYYAYVGGFDWDLRHLSPGKVQMDSTVAWLIEHGAQRYDLLINPAEYKASWTNSTVAVSSRAEALTWRGRFYASTWLPSLRPALKQFHGRIPALIDRTVSLLRPAACLLLYV